MSSRLIGISLVALTLAACAPTAVQQPVARPAANVPLPARTGLEAVIGRTAASLSAQFGTAILDVREGAARKLQYAGPACVLDAYLYPPPAGGEAIVTHVDARKLDGTDFDRASCIAALAAQKQVR
jgi:hypothetical protein